jgi:hypothetical protein
MIIRFGFSSSEKAFTIKAPNPKTIIGHILFTVFKFI